MLFLGVSVSRYIKMFKSVFLYWLVVLILYLYFRMVSVQRQYTMAIYAHSCDVLNTILGRLPISPTFTFE